MKRIAILVLSALALFAGACKKKETTNTTPATTAGGLRGPYYYNFKLNDSSFQFDGGFIQYIFLYENEAGGYQAKGNNFSPAASLSVNVPNGDTISEAQLLGLKGKTIYFDDTILHPKVGFDYDLAGASWESVDTNNHSFFVTISDVTFLKNDTSIGYYVRAYVVTGTCNALVQRNGAMKVMSDGNFHFVIGKRDLK